MKTICSPEKCKVRRHPEYEKIVEMREKGKTLEELVSWTEENPPKVSTRGLSEHFNKHMIDFENPVFDHLSTSELGEIISEQINLIKTLVEEERQKDNPDKRVISKLVDTMRKLIEDHLKNRKLYYEHRDDSPDALVRNLKEVLAKTSMSQTSKKELIDALEEDLNLK